MTESQLQFDALRIGPEQLDLVERLVDRHHAEGTSPGLAYGIVAGGELVHAGGRGTARVSDAVPLVPDADTVFRIASMTKSFTAATVLLLRDEGRLRLDDDVVTFVPEAAALRPPTDDAPPITIRSLLTMSAGLPTDNPWGDRQQDLPDDDFAALLAGGLSFAWVPGTIFEYSNLGYALLGRVIAAAAGAPYDEVVTDRLLRPIGLSRTGFTPSIAADGPLAHGHRRGATDRTESEEAGGEWEAGASGEAATSDERTEDGAPSSAVAWQPEPFAGHGSFAPMGGLFSTVHDLSRWVRGLVGAFPPRDGSDDHPLCRASRRELQLPHLGLPPVLTWRTLAEPPVVRGISYGFGLEIERDPHVGTLVSHSGGYPGFGSHMRWHPGTGLGVVVLGNATYAPAPRLAARIVDALLGAVTTPRAPALSRRPGASPAPATGSMVEATAAARADVTRLITDWDDELAARIFAMNVELDEPAADRRRHWAELAGRLGPLGPDDTEPITSTSPAHAAWWLRGPGGRVRVEIRLDPQRPARVQSVALTVAADLSPSLARIVERLSAGLAADAPQWPDDVPVADSSLLPGWRRQLAVAAAWSGPCTVGPVLAGDGVREATVSLRGERLDLVLALGTDPSGAVSTVSLTPAPA